MGRQGGQGGQEGQGGQGGQGDKGDKGELLSKFLPCLPPLPCLFPMPYTLCPITNDSTVCVYARTTFLIISRPTSLPKVMIDSG